MWSGAPPHRDRPVPLRTMSAMMGRQTANQAHYSTSFALKTETWPPAGARRAIRSYPRIIPAGQSSCAISPPFQRGTKLSRATHVPNVR
jgi:hypothetical protein